MKKIIYFAITALAAAMLFSCGAIEKATDQKIKINEMSFKMDPTKTITRSSTISANDFTCTFSYENFGDLKDCINLIKSITINGNVLLKGLGSYNLTDFNVTAEIGGSQFKLLSNPHNGTVAAIPAAALKTFADKILAQLIAKKEITIWATGTTDAPVGTSLPMEFALTDVLVIAGLDL